LSAKAHMHIHSNMQLGLELTIEGRRDSTNPEKPIEIYSMQLIIIKVTFN